MLAARRLRAVGRVQGVGFRQFVAEAARAEGVSGWVRNRPDGAVEAFLEGEADAVDRVERSVRRGPPLARVDEVTATPEAVAGRPAGFRIEL
jgi:acylphosphatase